MGNGVMTVVILSQVGVSLHHVQCWLIINLSENLKCTCKYKSILIDNHCAEYLVMCLPSDNGHLYVTWHCNDLLFCSFWNVQVVSLKLIRVSVWPKGLY